MADLKINYATLQTAMKLAREINSELDHSYKVANDLKRYLSSAKWKGQTKDAFEAYIALIIQYHADLIDIMTDHETVVKNLKQSIDDYHNTSEVSAIKGL